jgi:hypothetical protein
VTRIYKLIETFCKLWVQDSEPAQHLSPVVNHPRHPIVQQTNTINQIEDIFGIKTPELNDDYIDLDVLNGFEKVMVYSKWGVAFFWSAQ